MLKFWISACQQPPFGLVADLLFRCRAGRTARTAAAAAALTAATLPAAALLIGAGLRRRGWRAHV